MMNLTRSQLFSIVSVVLGVLVASTGQLTDLIGPSHTKLVVSFAGLLSAIVSGVGGILTGQVQQVQAVAAMPGVEPIRINEKANTALAQLAVSPDNPKIAPTPEALQTVANTANKA